MQIALLAGFPIGRRNQGARKACQPAPGVAYDEAMSSSSESAPPDATVAWFQHLPPPLRIGVYLLGCLVGSLVWCGCVWLICRPGLDVWTRPDRYPLAASLYLAGTYVLWVGGALWTWQRLEGASFARLGLAGDGRWIWRFGQGLGWGLASMALLVWLELRAGWVLWGQAAWDHTPWSAPGLAAVSALFFGLTEEVLFRGFVFGVLRRGWGAGTAIAASGWFYALVHFLRVDLGWQEVVTPFAGLWLAGALLAWTVERTGSLWLATGLHTGWIALFLLADRQHLLGYPQAFAWLTGGGFPLGGLLALAMLVAVWLGLGRSVGPGIRHTVGDRSAEEPPSLPLPGRERV